MIWSVRRGVADCPSTQRLILLQDFAGNRICCSCRRSPLLVVVAFGDRGSDVSEAAAILLLLLLFRQDLMPGFTFIVCLLIQSSACSPRLGCHGIGTGTVHMTECVPVFEYMFKSMEKNRTEANPCLLTAEAQKSNFIPHPLLSSALPPVYSTRPECNIMCSSSPYTHVRERRSCAELRLLY